MCTWGASTKSILAPGAVGLPGAGRMSPTASPTPSPSPSTAPRPGMATCVCLRRARSASGQRSRSPRSCPGPSPTAPSYLPTGPDLSAIRSPCTAPGRMKWSRAAGVGSRLWSMDCRSRAGRSRPTAGLMIGTWKWTFAKAPGSPCVTFPNSTPIRSMSWWAADRSVCRRPTRFGASKPSSNSGARANAPSPRPSAPTRGMPMMRRSRRSGGWRKMPANAVACRQRRIGSAAKRRNRLAVVSSVSESVPVTRPALDPNWRMTILFLLCLAVLALLMKLIVLRGPDRSKAHNRAFVLSPILTPESFKRSRPLSTIPGLCLRTLLVWGALWLYYWIYGILVRTLDIPRFYLGYLAAPVVLLMGEGGFGVISLLWLPSGRLLPPLHRQPLLARGVADFWGRRWNLWFSDWFRHALFARMWRRPGVALFWVFFVSGLMHEWVLNLPLWLVTGRRCFGTMMLYFLLQAGG